MSKITIVVKEGRVENVYATDANLMVDIIDMDIQDQEELLNLEKELEEVKKEQYEIL